MNSIIGRVEQLSISTSYWQSHWLWLAIAWYGLAFVALLIRKKLHDSIFIRAIRGVLYLGVYAITLGLVAASIWRLFPIFYRFDTWPFWRRVHLLIEIILAFVSVYHLFNGICSVFSSDARNVFYKLESPLGHLYRALVVLCVFILNRYYLGVLLMVLALGEWWVLRGNKAPNVKED